MKLHLLLRGHVRDAFDNENFLNLLREICAAFNCNIYIHTWNVRQTSRSWRAIADDKRLVDGEFLRHNLQDVFSRVKGLIVEDENTVQLLGKTEGNIGYTACSYRGYKSMFYGKLRVAELAYNIAPPGELALQTRFDILSPHLNACNHGDAAAIVNFLQHPPATPERIKFMRQGPATCIENIYAADVADMYKFIRHFYTNFDVIYARHSQTPHQELPVFFERNNF